MFGQLEDSGYNDRIIATLQFGTQNVSFICAENVAVFYQEQLPDSSMSKNVTNGPTKVSYLV